jgi:hypothetical protein
LPFGAIECESAQIFFQRCLHLRLQPRIPRLARSILYLASVNEMIGLDAAIGWEHDPPMEISRARLRAFVLFCAALRQRLSGQALFLRLRNTKCIAENLRASVGVDEFYTGP